VIDNLVWKDLTSYSQGQIKRTARVLEVKLVNISLLVHRHIDYTGWLLSSNDLDLEKVKLKSEDVEDAKVEALNKLNGILSERISEYSRIKSIIS